MVGKIVDKIVGRMVDKIVGKKVGKIVAKIVGKLVGKMVGKAVEDFQTGNFLLVLHRRCVITNCLSFCCKQQPLPKVIKVETSSKGI